MNFETALYLYAAFFAIALAVLFYFVAVKRRNRILFGGEIEKTYGEIEINNPHPLVAKKLRVHKVVSTNKKSIAIELDYNQVLSYQTTPIVLSREEAQRLVDLINLAKDET